MKLTGEPCPICSNPIRPLDSMRNLNFHGRPEKLHHRCWFENQDLITILEQNDPELTLEQSVKKSRQIDPSAGQ
jgi:hypothetical protein